MFEKIKETKDYILSRVDFEPEFGIILGTGLGNLVKEVEIVETINYEDIPNFPLSTVESHKGRLIFGHLAGKAIVAMQGRFHYYEGYDMQQITFPVRVMQMLGIRGLFVSNACGSVNPVIKTGDMMILKDHINLLPEHPLRGPNLEELGPRFPDMSEPYKRDWIEKAMEIATSKNMKIHKGVYASVQGPNLETSAEYKWLNIIGADVVGMSTVPEVLVARHMDIPVFAISVITDEGFHEELEPVSVEDVIAAASKTEPHMTLIMKELIASL